MAGRSVAKKAVAKKSSAKKSSAKTVAAKTAAAAIARHLGTDHTEMYVQPSDGLAVIPRLPAMFDEPVADVSQIPTYLVAELARRQVTE